MTNKQALLLALVAAGLAAVLCRYEYAGIAFVAATVSCFLAVWPIRLKWGLAGQEQWKRIRVRGRTHFVVTHGVAVFACLGVWEIAVNYIFYKRWGLMAWRLSFLLCVGLAYGIWQWRSHERNYSEQGQLQ